MATLYTEQDKNIRRTWLLIALFLVVIISLGWFFGLVLNEPLILYIAIIFSFGMNFISYWYSDKIVLSMAGAKEADTGEYRALYNVVENLSITAGLPRPRIYVINDPAPNAFATGRNKEKAVVAVTTGLLARLNQTELEGVIAHELSHIGNRDILLSTIVVMLVGFIALLSDFFLRFTFFGLGGRNEKGGLQAILGLIGIVLAILTPLIGLLIQLAVSRKREFLADATGALLTRYPEGLASALEKISQYDGSVRRASNATAHLFIANPFGAQSLGLHKLFMTHPPTKERIEVLRGLKV